MQIGSVVGSSRIRRSPRAVFFVVTLGALALGCASRAPSPPPMAPTESPLPEVTSIAAPRAAASEGAADAAQASVLVGAWPVEKRRELLAKTRSVKLAPDLGALTAAERAAVDKLVQVGKLFQQQYEDLLHKDSEVARTVLRAESAPADLRALYRVFSSPVATTLENQRVPFLGVAAEVPGRNFYPWGVSKTDIEAHLQGQPQDRAEILGIRTVVRRAEAALLDRDLATLDRYPVLDALHPGLRQRLTGLERRSHGFYAVPYAVAFAGDMVKAHGLLFEAAALLEASDKDFAGYLRNRARDLLSNDYESGDAAWVTGRFGRLNAEIGSYETYDDQLYGVKASPGVSILLKDVAATDRLRAAIKDLQGIENSLPYERKKPVRSDISVGIYDIIADFGQARGLNTATILPNDADYSRRYGRTILLRANVLRHPELFRTTSSKWKAAVASGHADDLTIEGGFYRTLWHEIGHYLGVDKTADGRSLELALEENESVFEEMKSDLVALHAVQSLKARGYYDGKQARAVYADGIRRTLLTVKPRREQPYQTMMLMQMNYFLEHGLLGFDQKSGRLVIRYANYPRVVLGLLRAVLAVQSEGDRKRSDAFIERYSAWRDDLHGVVAKNLAREEDYRYALIDYGVLE